MSRNISQQIMAFESAPSNSRAVLLNVEIPGIGELRLTDYDRPLTFSGDAFAPAGFDVSDYDSETGRISVTLRSLEGYSAFRSLIFAQTRTVNMSLRNAVVQSSDVTDSSYPYFSGRFSGGGYSNGIVSLEASNRLLGLNGSIGANFIFQHSCPHVLYGSKCNASKAAATTSVSVVSFDREARTVTLQAPIDDPSHYSLGSLEVPGTGESVFVLGAQTDQTFRLAYVPSSLSAPLSVNLSKGCPRTVIGCRSIHDNTDYFGGFVGIPIVGNAAVDGVSSSAGIGSTQGGLTPDSLLNPLFNPLNIF